jgi:hypothetical protein
VLRHRVARLLLFGPVLGVLAPSARAQTKAVLGADAFIRSGHVWRGTTRSAAWSLQPDVYLSATSPALLASVGWWSNIEIGAGDPANPADVGLGRSWFGQNDLWLEISATAGPARLVGGVARYLFAGGAYGQASDAVNTTELYAAAWTNAGPTVPRLALWYDVDRVSGAYLETSVDVRVPTLPSKDPVLGLYLSALAGWCAGQEVNPREPDQAAYFAASGLTHIDLGLSLTLGKDNRYLTLDFHVLPVREDGARAAGAGDARTWSLSLGFSDYLVAGVF